MTLQDYAKYLLSACGRRFTNLYRRHYLESTNALPSLSALLSYLRTQTASIYTHLLSRGCTQSTPTFANLLPTIHQLDTRKVEVGTSTTIADGQHLVPLLCDTSVSSLVTELIDNAPAWDFLPNNTIFSIFPNITKATLNCKSFGNTYLGYAIGSTSCELSLPELETVYVGRSINGAILCNNEVITLQKLKTVQNNLQFYHNSLFANIPCREINMPLLTSLQHTRAYDGPISNCANLEVLKMDSLQHMPFNAGGYDYGYFLANCPNLIEVHIGNGYAENLYIEGWSPTNVLADATKTATLLSNFMQYIATRLANRTGQTTLRITLSQEVRDVLTSEIEHEIVDIRNWEISPAKSV